MHQAVSQLPSTTGRCVWYMDRSILSMVRRQTSNGVKNSTLTMENVGGTMQTSWGGYPIRRVDALKTNEATISQKGVERNDY